MPYIVDFRILHEFIDRLAELGGELLEIPQQAEYNEGFMSLHIAMGVPSEEIFYQVEPMAKEKLHLQNWYLISPSLYSKGQTLDTRKMPVNQIVPFLDDLRWHGIHNSARQEWFENPSTQNTYHGCHWIIEETVPENLLQAVKKAGDLNCSLYFLNYEQIGHYHSIYFGIRLSKKTSLKAFLKYTGTASILTGFKRIEEKELYLGSRLNVMGEHWINHIIPEQYMKTLAAKNHERQKSDIHR